MAFKTPAQCANAVCNISVAKANLPIDRMFVLAILAGAYIGFGAALATTVLSGGTGDLLGVGFAKFMAGSVFSVGLMLVVIAGAELFTGNNLLCTGRLAGRIDNAGLLKNWAVVYIGNFVGSLLLVYLVFNTGLSSFWGATAIKIAEGKIALPFAQAFFRGILCNWLVCLAVWLAISAEDVVGKIFACYFPIMAFVASGFEHSIANMYFIPMGIFLSPATVTWAGFMNNLIPVTLGNIVGGGIFVGSVYYFVHAKSLEPVEEKKEEKKEKE